MLKHQKNLVVALICCGFLGLLADSCSRNSEQSASRSAALPSSGSDSLSTNDNNKPSTDKPVSINNSVIKIQLNHTISGMPVGMSSVPELFVALYSPVLAQEGMDTLIISGLYLAPVKGKEKTYCAVVDLIRNSPVSASERYLDIFMFKDTNTSNLVLGHTTFNPLDDGFSIANLSGGLFQLNRQGEYALSFEYLVPEHHTPNVQSRYVYLYRLSPSMPRKLEQIFEYCILNKTGESPDEQGEFTVQITDSSVVTSQWKWGRELYTIVITKTIIRKGDVDAGAHKIRTIKSKTHFEWINGKYTEVFQQDLTIS